MSSPTTIRLALRRLVTALVILVCVCAGHWAAIAAAATSGATEVATQARDVGSDAEHAMACSSDFAILTTDRNRFALDVILPSVFREPTCVALASPASPDVRAGLVLSASDRRALLQVFRI